MGKKNKLAELIRCCLTMISPKLNTKILYYRKLHKRLNLDHPETFNEKIQWLKFNTYWNNPVVKQCADKYRVREYLQEKGFSELLIPLIGAYDDVGEIPWDTLPERFVLKLNSGCGYNLVVTDKSKLDISRTQKTLREWMKSRYWLLTAELQYKDVKPYILIEDFLSSGTGELPVDYKFFCMNGKSKYVMACVERGSETGVKFYFFDRDWNMMLFTDDAVDDKDRVIPKPDGLDEAFDCAEKLAQGFPFVRVDLYIVNGKIYFGELTFTPSAGMNRHLLPEADLKLGEELQL